MRPAPSYDGAPSPKLTGSKNGQGDVLQSINGRLKAVTRYNDGY